MVRVSIKGLTLLLVATAVLFGTTAWAQISSYCVWEVRSPSTTGNGSDTNGGGFVPGSGGTDWSQQNTPKYSVTNAVTNGTNAVTSATANFGADVVGNIAYIAGGTGAVKPAWYQIITITNSTTLVLDRPTGLTAGTGVTVHIGGGLLTILPTIANWTAGMRCYCHGQTAVTTGFTFSVSGSPSNTTNYSRYIGYGTTRGDNKLYSISLEAANLTAITVSGNGFSLENLDIHCAEEPGSTGITVLSSASETKIIKCSVEHFAKAGIVVEEGTTGARVSGCNISLSFRTSTSGISVGSGAANMVSANNVHDNQFVVGGAAIICGQGSTALFNVVTNINGTADGIQADSNTTVLHNTIANISRDCLRATSAFNTGLLWQLNIFATGATGLDFPSGAVPADMAYDGNAYFNCGVNRVNCDAVTGQNAYLPYMNVFDVLLGKSISPFKNPSGNDFSLASNASGRACVDILVFDQDSTPSGNYTFMGAQGPHI